MKISIQIEEQFLTCKLSACVIHLLILFFVVALLFLSSRVVPCIEFSVLQCIKLALWSVLMGLFFFLFNLFYKVSLCPAEVFCLPISCKRKFLFSCWALVQILAFSLGIQSQRIWGRPDGKNRTSAAYTGRLSL